METTQTNSYTRLIAQQRDLVFSGINSSPAARQKILTTLHDCLYSGQVEIEKALIADLGKSRAEIYSGETGFVLRELAFARKHLRRWMRRKSVATALLTAPATSYSTREPFGSVLVLGAWNFPVQLTLVPAVAAIAAGNSVVIKPSEHAQETARVLETLINSRFDSSVLRVINGDSEVASELCAAGFDHIFFTGSEQIGRKVYQAAAQTLTPVTLELGGKNPCIVAPDANIQTAARRIVFGKFFNAGQTCLSPDSVLVHKSVADEFSRSLVGAITEFYGEDPSTSKDYGRLIHQPHFNRLQKLLSQAKVLHGGRTDSDSRYFEPSIVGAPAAGSALETEEIFGPILPLIPYSDSGDLHKKLKKFSTPLAFYLFSSDSQLHSSLKALYPSGAFVQNDCTIQAVNHKLPFGGVGSSGFGSYHGYEGFLRLSRPVAHLKRPRTFGFPLVFPPYGEFILKIVKKLGKLS